jgi:hypothetical protein
MIEEDGLTVPGVAKLLGRKKKWVSQRAALSGAVKFCGSSVAKERKRGSSNAKPALAYVPKIVL